MLLSAKFLNVCSKIAAVFIGSSRRIRLGLTRTHLYMIGVVVGAFQVPGPAGTGASGSLLLQLKFALTIDEEVTVTVTVRIDGLNWVFSQPVGTVLLMELITSLVLQQIHHTPL